jgi:hypothetical protein
LYQTFNQTSGAAIAATPDVQITHFKGPATHGVLVWDLSLGGLGTCKTAGPFAKGRISLAKKFSTVLGLAVKASSYKPDSHT